MDGITATAKVGKDADSKENVLVILTQCFFFSLFILTFSHTNSFPCLIFTSPCNIHQQMRLHEYFSPQNEGKTTFHAR